MAGTPEYVQLNKNLEIVDGHAVKAPEDYQDPEQLYQALVARVRKYHPSTDISMIEKAYRIGKKAHKEIDIRIGSRISSILSGWGSSWRTLRWIKRPSWRGCSTMRWKIRI